MTIPLTAYGYPSHEWKLPEHLSHCGEAVRAWGEWTHYLPLAWTPIRGEGDKVFVNVKASLEYTPDTKFRWQPPEELLCSPSDSYLRGDCEDFAMCFAGLAHRALGIDPSDLFVTVMHLPDEDVIHAVCIIRTPEGNKVLDQRAIEVMDDTPTPDIVPLFSIALNGDSFLHGAKL